MAKEDIVKYEFQEGHKFAKGRPKGSRNLSSLVKEMLSAEIDIVNPLSREMEKLSYQQLIIIGQMQKAIHKKDTRAAEWLFEIGFGKVKDVIDIEATVEGGATFKNLIRAFKTNRDK